MGKPTGFMEIKRQTSMELPPEERIQNFNEFHVPLHTDEQQAPRCPLHGLRRALLSDAVCCWAAWYSGCPLHNLIPEWNDLVYHGQVGSGRTTGCSRPTTSRSLPAGSAPLCARRPAPAAWPPATR